MKTSSLWFCSWPGRDELISCGEIPIAASATVWEGLLSPSVPALSAVSSRDDTILCSEYFVSSSGDLSVLLKAGSVSRVVPIVFDLDPVETQERYSDASN